MTETREPCADDLLAHADACHDDDAAAAAAQLRALPVAQLSPGRRPRAAFLFNHVLGEKLGRWAEAHSRVQALLDGAAGAPGAQPPPHVLWRQAGAAAARAGDTLGAARHARALAAATGAAVPRATELIQLAAASFALEGRPPADAAATAQTALAPLAGPAWEAPTPLDADAAALCNNIASHFVDRPLAALAHPALREALAEAARLSEAFWRRAGTWVQQERACYLRALAAHALGAPGEALQHAQHGLELIVSHDHDNAEDVDRAFLTLELALGYRRLGRLREAAQAQSVAEALARRFGDEALERWFGQRVARNEALLKTAQG